MRALFCDGCSAYFPSNKVLVFRGNVEDGNGGGIIGNSLIRIPVPVASLGEAWGKVSLRDREAITAISDKAAQEVVYRTLTYCKECTFQILNDAFDRMEKQE